MKKSLIITIGIILTISLTAITVAYTQSNEYTLGVKVKEIKDEKLIAKVNGLPITDKEFLSKKIYIESAGKSTSNKEILKAIVEQKLLIKEAKNQGIIVSEKELKDFINMQKQLSQQVSDEEKSKFRDFLAGQGLTEEEYWKDPKTIQTYGKGLYIAKLRNKFISELQESERNTPKAEELINNKINQIINSANIEVLYPEYK